MFTEFEITVTKRKTSQTYTGLFGDEMPVAAKLTKKALPFTCKIWSCFGMLFRNC